MVSNLAEYILYFLFHAIPCKTNQITAPIDLCRNISKERDVSVPLGLLLSHTCGTEPYIPTPFFCDDIFSHVIVYAHFPIVRLADKVNDSVRRQGAAVSEPDQLTLLQLHKRGMNVIRFKSYPSDTLDLVHVVSVVIELRPVWDKVFGRVIRYPYEPGIEIKRRDDDPGNWNCPDALARVIHVHSLMGFCKADSYSLPPPPTNSSLRAKQEN